MSFLALSFKSWILSTTLSSLLVNSFSALFSSVIVFSAVCTSLYFLSLCWSSHCVHIFICVQWAVLWLLLLIYQLDYLSSFHQGLFLKACLVLSFGTYFCFVILFDALFLCIRWDGDISVSWSTDFVYVRNFIIQPCSGGWLSFEPLYCPTAWFILDRFLLLKVYQDFSVLQGEGSHFVLSFRLFESQIRGEQVLKYANI